MDQLRDNNRSDERGADLRLAASAYLPVLDDDAGSAIVRLVRQIRVAGEQIITGAVWSESFENSTDADKRYRWLIANADRLTEWGRVAAILGPEALTTTLDAAWLAELERIEKQRRMKEKEAKEAETIWLIQDDVGRHERPAIIMHMGNQRSAPFITIKLDERWEQERIWDWARWQTERYREWKAHCDEHGAKSLEQLIMTEMLKTENAVKKAGLGSGGRRPLRFWRGDAK